MVRSYSDYVFAQSRRNPCLRNLCQFIANDSAKNPCRIVSLEFHAKEAKPSRVDLDLLQLRTIVTSNSSDCQGRIIIVEDLSKPIIETLGSSLDIDPLFFASHIHGAKVEITSSMPSMALLPSKVITRNFLSLQYQRSIDFGVCSITPRKLSRSCNVPRKVVLLPPTKNTYIGLEQQSCSVLLSNTKSKSWLGLILVDQPYSDQYTSLEKRFVLPSRAFQGGYEDFSERPSFFEPNMGCPGRVSRLEDLVYYWQKNRPPAFDSANPTLLSLTYYPSKIVVAEWVCYVAVMSNSIKQYEYTTEASEKGDRLEGIDSDLRSLEVWGRRCLQTTSKLQSTIHFLQHRTKGKTGLEEYTLLIRDFEHIAALVDTYGRRLETMVPVVTSVLQIADTRRSLKEAANVTRLTNLALLFVPLSFVASLFSMDGGPSRDDLATYFSVALPLSVVVFFVARLPIFDLAKVFGKVKTWSKRRSQR